MIEGKSSLQKHGDLHIDQASLNHMTSILVVDDEPAVLKVLVTRLKLAGYQVLEAKDGEEALEIFHRESPDLVVLDQDVHNDQAQFQPLQ